MERRRRTSKFPLARRAANLLFRFFCAAARCALTPGCISNLRKLLLTIRIIHKGLPLGARFLPSTLARSCAATAPNSMCGYIFYTTFLLLEIETWHILSHNWGAVVEKGRIPLLLFPA